MSIVKMPKLGESIIDAKIVTWLKVPGDIVKKDEPLVEVTTDKLSTEIPSPFAGTLVRHMAVEGETIDIEAPLCEIREGAGSVEQEPSFISPRVMQLAAEHKIPLEELRTIVGTGEGGRVTKKDVEVHAAQKPAEPMNLEIAERVQLSNARKMIRDNLEKSTKEIPHAYLITTIDMTSVLNDIEQKQSHFKEGHGFKLTPNYYFAWAASEALKKFPDFNAKFRHDHLHVEKAVHLGVAVSVDHHVVVPVLRHADTMAFEELAVSLHALIKRAKAGTLVPEELSGGTFTVTNFGMSGIELGIPIIRYPECGILALGAITKEAVVMGDDKIEIRPRLQATFAFDHRVKDGMEAASFLSYFKHLLMISFGDKNSEGSHST
ncbi:MAG: hypothetical protein A3F09_02285 [Chlamydiae bacterium RIFCSPHIGHO2_12_FULL_49_11]|nr:MAG: hypothetical protein A3F09_02285 [Chlamydiae bacterium RIFCSPHIGHO2_12_FULL_49_11]